MIPGKVGMTIMIPNIYYNHIQQVKEQLKRKPLKYPTLQIKKHINSYDDIINLKYDDIELYDYYYHPKLTAPMTV
jgi:thymidylate synthase